MEIYTQIPEILWNYLHIPEKFHAVGKTFEDRDLILSEECDEQHKAANSNTSLKRASTP